MSHQIEGSNTTESNNLDFDQWIIDNNLSTECKRVLIEYGVTTQEALDKLEEDEEKLDELMDHLERKQTRLLQKALTKSAMTRAASKNEAESYEYIFLHSFMIHNQYILAHSVMTHTYRVCRHL